MLNDLRNQPEAAQFNEEETPVVEDEPPRKKPKKVHRRRSFDQVVGMNAFQRFVLSLMLFITILLLGSMLLMFTEKVELPFLF